MKIIHVTHLYYPSQGGVQFFFKNVSERLVKDYGDDVTVVTTDSMYGPERKIYKKAGPHQEVVNGVKVLRFPYQRWHIKPFYILSKVFKKLSLKVPENISLKAYGPFSPAMKKYLLNVTADAVCASSSNYYFMQLPLWRKCNFFYYGSIHFNDDESKSLLYRKQVESINASTLYLANTHFEIDRLVKQGVKKDKIFVLGTGVDMEPFLNVSDTTITRFKNDHKIPEGVLVIGYVGRIEVTKNVLLLIKAFEKVSQVIDNVYLVIAGSGNEYVSELKKYCFQLPDTISNRIKFHINFSAEEKAVIFSSIDVFVLPSHNESFGLVFLEAWSCKKPVIGAAIGAVQNVINEGKDGLLMKINDVHSLSEKLLLLLSDAELRRSMGEAGYTKVKENYTWDIIVSRLRSCYLNFAEKQQNYN